MSENGACILLDAIPLQGLRRVKTYYACRCIQILEEAEWEAQREMTKYIHIRDNATLVHVDVMCPGSKDYIHECGVF